MNSLYNPFTLLDLVGNKCFLTGKLVNKNIDSMTVFPEWIMQSEDLYSKEFKMLDEQYLTYNDLRLGVSMEVFEKIEALNKKIEKAFTTGDTKDVEAKDWFQWTGIITYGLILAEIKNGLTSTEYKEEGFKVSPVLIEKFKNLHYQLQSIILNFEWDNPLPFSLFVFNIEESETFFEHRNEINTLTFSFIYKKLGVVICLQDLGNNKIYHSDLLKTIGSHSLKQIQFAEFAAKVYYSNYLFNYIPEFKYTQHQDVIYLSNSEMGFNKNNMFKLWEEKVYAQVLEAFWKPWSYSKLEILKNPDRSMSFINDENNAFINEPQIIPLSK